EQERAPAHPRGQIGGGALYGVHLCLLFLTRATSSIISLTDRRPASLTAPNIWLISSTRTPSSRSRTRVLLRSSPLPWLTSLFTVKCLSPTAASGGRWVMHET